MKRKLSFIAAAFLALSPFSAFAAQIVNLEDSVTIVLPSDGSTYTLHSNSKFDNLTVSGDNFSFGLVDGSIVDITSSDKKKLTNTLNIPTICQADNTYVSLVLTSTPSSTTTVTVTPTGNACTGAGGSPSSSSGGGGGGGGGGGSTVITTPTPAPAPAPSPTPVPTPSASSKPLFALIVSTLASGSKGDQVKALQQFLGVQQTGLYGPLTRAAVQKFQEQYGIAKKGQTGYGVVGPKTRAKLNELMQGASLESPLLSPAPAPAPAAPLGLMITSVLASGSKGDQVKALQQFLGVQQTGLYGPLTRAAVQKFQEQYGIAKKGQTGYGVVGPKTRAKLNEVIPRSR